MVLSGSLMVLGACEARDPGQADGTAPPGATADAAAQGGVLTLTGCLQRGSAPGEFVLASVGTAGVIGTTGDSGDERSWTVEPGDTERSQGRIAAATSYRLVTMGEGENLDEYVGQRVTTRGRLAHETPAAAGQQQDIPEEGVLVESGPTQAVVQGSTTPLRAFYYESVSRVADTCEP